MFLFELFCPSFNILEIFRIFNSLLEIRKFSNFECVHIIFKIIFWVIFCLIDDQRILETSLKTLPFNASYGNGGRIYFVNHPMKADLIPEKQCLFVIRK